MLVQDLSIPPTHIQTSDEITERTKQFLIDEGYVEEGEEVLYYYGAGFTFEEDGNILTDRRVVSYGEGEDDVIESHSVWFDDLDRAVVAYSESEWEDSVLRVYSKQEGDWIELLLSTERGRDHDFVEETVRRAKSVDGSSFTELTEVESFDYEEVEDY